MMHFVLCQGLTPICFSHAPRRIVGNCAVPPSEHNKVTISAAINLKCGCALMVDHSPFFAGLGSEGIGKGFAPAITRTRPAGASRSLAIADGRTFSEAAGGFGSVGIGNGFAPSSTVLYADMAEASRSCSIALDCASPTFVTQLSISGTVHSAITRCLNLFRSFTGDSSSSVVL